MATNLGAFYTAENAMTNPEMPKVTQAMYNRTLLKRALPLLLHQKFGQQKPLKRRNGTSMVFRRYEDLAKSLAPLTEGVTPSGADLTKSEVVATIKQYGNFTTITDMLDMAGFDPIINEASELLGENMGQTLDTIYREILNAGTVWWGMAAASAATENLAIGSTATPLNKTILDKAINLLENAKAKKFTTLVQGAPKDNTWPLAPAYWAVVHPDVVEGLYNADSLTVGSEFTPVEQYSAQTQVMEGEVGKYRSLRFVQTTEAKVHAGVGVGSADVYSTLIFGRDAYGIVPLEGGSSRTIIHRAGSNTDPLNQRNTVAWKAATTAVILRDDYMVRLHSTV